MKSVLPNVVDAPLHQRGPYWAMVNWKNRLDPDGTGMRCMIIIFPLSIFPVATF